MKKNEKYIYRIHNKTCNGWLLIMKNKGLGLKYTEMFSASTCDGVHNSLQYARDTRDLVLAVVRK